MSKIEEKNIVEAISKRLPKIRVKLSKLYSDEKTLKKAREKLFKFNAATKEFLEAR